MGHYGGRRAMAATIVGVFFCVLSRQKCINILILSQPPLLMVLNLIVKDAALVRVQLIRPMQIGWGGKNTKPHGLCVQ